MERSKNSNGKKYSDKEVLEIVQKELKEFEELIRGHEKLLKAIGEL